VLDLLQAIEQGFLGNAELHKMGNQNWWRPFSAFIAPWQAFCEDSFNLRVVS
jgi:hypothetical protein